MPAYDLNGAYAIFFIVFMLINLYIFVNIILATIYTNYKKHLKVSTTVPRIWQIWLIEVFVHKDEVKQSLELKRNKIKDAFDLIKFPHKTPIEVDNGDKNVENIKSHFDYVIEYEVFEKLMRNVNTKLTEKHIKILFELLDLDGNKLLSILSSNFLIIFLC